MTTTQGARVLGEPVGAPTAVIADLWERLVHVERRVRSAVAARRAADPHPDDPYRGQYLTPEAAERIVESRDAFAPVPAYGSGPSPESPPGSRIQRLAEDFGLVPLDVDLLLVAMAPDIDHRFERLYGYLNDDLTRRRPTIGLALDLCGLPAASTGRFRFRRPPRWSRAGCWRSWRRNDRCCHGCCAYRTGSPPICSVTTRSTEGYAVSSGWPDPVRSRTPARRSRASRRRWARAADWCICSTGEAIPAGWRSRRCSPPAAGRWWSTSRPSPPFPNRRRPYALWRPRPG